MKLDRPDTAEADSIAALWLRLAREQHEHGSHLAADPNRAVITDTIRRGILADGVLVARAESDETTAADPGEVLGFVMFSSGSERLVTTIDRGTIENIYVRPDARGRGIGSELLEAAERELAAAGVDAIKLEVMASNDAARRFYERHGYDPHRIQVEKRVQSDNHSSD